MRVPDDVPQVHRRAEADQRIAPAGHSLERFLVLAPPAAVAGGVKNQRVHRIEIARPREVQVEEVAVLEDHLALDAQRRAPDPAAAPAPSHAPSGSEQAREQRAARHGTRSIRTVFSSIRVFGASPLRGAASIASTAGMPSTTRPNAV